MHLSPLSWSLKSLPGWPLLAESSKVRVVVENKVEHLVVLEFVKEPRAVWEDTGDFQTDRGLKAKPT